MNKAEAGRIGGRVRSVRKTTANQKHKGQGRHPGPITRLAQALGISRQKAEYILKKKKNRTFQEEAAIYLVTGR